MRSRVAVGNGVSVIMVGSSVSCPGISVAITGFSTVGCCIEISVGATVETLMGVNAR